MPDLRWIAALALGLMLIGLEGRAQEEGGDAQSREEVEQPSAEAFRLPVEIIESKEAAEARERREAEAAQREKDDLVAQQGMNAATQAMNEATQSMKDAAWLSTFFVLIGTGLLFWTLLETRRANKAAQTAVAVTRAVGAAQTQAYLSINAERVTLADAARNGKRSCTFRFNWENTGQSPARNVNMTLRSYLEYEDTIGPDQPISRHVADYVAPRSKQRQAHIAIECNAQAIEAVLRGEAKLRCSVELVWEHNFGNDNLREHWTTEGTLLSSGILYLTPKDERRQH